MAAPTALELLVLTDRIILIEEPTSIVMRCCLQVAELMIMSAQMLGPFKLVRTATNLEEQYQFLGTKYKLSGPSSMNQVFT